LVEAVDELHAASGEVVDHVAVVDDLVEDVYGGAVDLERALDDLDCAVDAGAEAAGVGEADVHQGLALSNACVVMTSCSQNRSDALLRAWRRLPECPAIPSGHGLPSRRFGRTVPGTARRA